MKIMPAGLLVEGDLCVVVGAGKVGARKARALVEAGARVRVVGRRFSAEFDQMEDIEKVRGEYEREALAGARVVIAATCDRETNLRVARDARKAGALVNVVDVAGESDFIFPAVIRRGEVAASVSTGGASPTLARKLKERLLESIDDAYGDLAAILGQLRERAIKEIPDGRERRDFFEELAGDEFLDVIRSEGAKEALRRAEALLESRISGGPRGGGA